MITLVVCCLVEQWKKKRKEKTNRIREGSSSVSVPIVGGSVLCAFFVDSAHGDGWISPMKYEFEKLSLSRSRIVSNVRDRMKENNDYP
jgi:hypothetical protein